jgi:outer membrane protein assembly factor BamA
MFRSHSEPDKWLPLLYRETGIKKTEPGLQIFRFFYLSTTFRSTILTQTPAILISRLLSPAIVLLLICCQTAIAGSSSVILSPQGRRIAHIYFNGNHITKERVITLYLRLDTGMVYDSVKIIEAKKRLYRTLLFSKVEILSIAKEYGCDLYVVVSERGYLHVPLPGIYQYPYKHGKNDRWFCADAGVEIDNFSGRMEKLRVMLRAWEWRTLGIGWTKPLLPSRYFIGLGLNGDQRSDEFFAFDRTDLAGRLTFGTEIFDYSKIGVSATPLFRQTKWIDTNGMGLADSLLKARWNGSPILLDYYQAYGSITWSTDRRETPFDPSRGWLLGLDTRSNYLYYDDNTPYVQQTAALNFYLPGFFDTDKFACRMVTVIRDKDAGYLNRLGIGGEGSVRGYGRNVIGLGLSEIPNNCFIFNAEYRFTMYTLFPIPVPFSSMVSPFIGNQKTVTPRIDGAFIVDYGRIAPGFSDLIHRKGTSYQSGTGIGFGFRFIEPVLQMCGCIDIVFAHRPSSRIFDFYPLPGLHLYTNLPF